MEKQFTDMGKRIKSRRKELHMTQGMLAESVNLSNNHISSIETGKYTPSLDTFVRICNSLDVTPDYLLLGSMRSDNVSQNLIDNLRLCDEHNLDIANHIISYMALMYGDKKN